MLLERVSFPPNSLVCTICTPNVCEPELEHFFTYKLYSDFGRILSKDVFKRRTSTGGEAFSLLICPDATKFLFLSVFFAYRDDLDIWATSLTKIARSPLPFGIRRSKTSFLKLPTTCILTLQFSDFESLKT